MAKTLQIVMPMAGLGSRFSKAGFGLPKPLILVDKMPMFQKALTSVAGIDVPKSYTFVIRQEHVDGEKLDQLIREHMPEAQMVILPEMTRGAAETVLKTTDKLDPDSPLIAMDCDLWFQSASYNDMVKKSFEGTDAIAGGLLTFPADNPRYSYAEIGPDGYVTRTAEKQVISDNAITGAYFFGTARDFTDATTELIQQPLGESMPEYYISHVYNILLAKGGKIRAATVDEFASFGTPEELADYEAKN